MARLFLAALRFAQRSLRVSGLNLILSRKRLAPPLLLPFGGALPFALALRFCFQTASTSPICCAVRLDTSFYGRVCTSLAPAGTARIFFAQSCMVCFCSAPTFLRPLSSSRPRPTCSYSSFEKGSGYAICDTSSLLIGLNLSFSFEVQSWRSPRQGRPPRAGSFHLAVVHSKNMDSPCPVGAPCRGQARACEIIEIASSPNRTCFGAFLLSSVR